MDGLFDDFGNNEEPIRLGGGVAERLLVGEGGADLIGAGDVDEREGVGGGLDPADVDLIQLFDVPENALELRAQFFLFGGREAESRQVGDVFDVEIRFRHGEKLRIKGETSRFNVMAQCV